MEVRGGGEETPGDLILQWITMCGQQRLKWPAKKHFKVFFILSLVERQGGKMANLMFCDRLPFSKLDVL